MDKILLKANRYYEERVLPSYTCNLGDYKEAQVIADKAMKAKDAFYFGDNRATLIKVAKGDVIVRTVAMKDKNMVQIAEVRKIDEDDYLRCKLVFEGELYEYENKPSLRCFDDLVRLAIANMNSINPRHFIL